MLRDEHLEPWIHHKLVSVGQPCHVSVVQVFDAVIVSVSFVLDVVFMDSKWYETGKDATTILVLLMPWRVVRIVNSKFYAFTEYCIICMRGTSNERLPLLTRKKNHPRTVTLTKENEPPRNNTTLE